MHYTGHVRGHLKLVALSLLGSLAAWDGGWDLSQAKPHLRQADPNAGSAPKNRVATGARKTKGPLQPPLILPNKLEVSRLSYLIEVHNY